MQNRQQYLQTWTPYPPAPAEVLYSGRVVEVRRQNSSLVLKTEKNQVVNEYSIPDSNWADILVPGDLIAVDGQERLHLLVPGESAPSKISIQTLKNWQKFIQLLRNFFAEQEFLEISTPGLVVCPGTEPSLEVFSTDIKKGSSAKKLFLPTSPELHLKKAMVYGFDPIYEIKNCYRNDEFSQHHQPEFTMLEWYRAYKNLNAIEKDIRDLFSYLISNFSDENLRCPCSYRVVTVAELFKAYTGFSIFPHSSLEDYKNIAKQLNLQIQGASSIDDYFFAIFLEKIESQFSPDEVIFVKDYPPFQAALARLTPQGWADRMEVYFAGLELANAFHELNDPKEQERRFKEDLAKKRAMGKTEIPLDEEFLKLLHKGLPPSAGVALGVERLFMALFGVTDIQKLKLFEYS